MQPLNTIISTSLFAITLVILALAIYAIRRREIPGSLQFSILCIMTAFYTFGYGMELLSQTLEKADFWSKFQYVGLPFIPAFWVLLSIAYSGKGIRSGRAVFYAALFAFPFLTMAFRLASDALPFQYAGLSLVSNGYFLVLDIVKGPWYPIHHVYFMACVVYSFLNYLKAYRNAGGYLRQQSLIMMLASIMPVCAVAVNFAGIVPLGLDSGPFTVMLDYLLFSFGMFSFTQQHLIPLSRKKVFDWMQDGVIVFNTQLDIYDFNKAAQHIFPELDTDCIGKNMSERLSGYADFTSKLKSWLQGSDNDLKDDNQESRQDRSDFEFKADCGEDGGECIYQVRISKLRHGRSFIGATVLISDITKQHEMIRQLETSARTDGLTRLMNREYFIERMQHEINRAIRENGGIALLLFDIDHFKRVNDRLGHQAGDHALKSLAGIVSKNIRVIDLAGRYGGDEFIVFLPDISPEEAGLVANRIRTCFESADISWSGRAMKLTASFGVTTFRYGPDHPAVDYDELVRVADEGLYKAKANGRNCVVISEYHWIIKDEEEEVYVQRNEKIGSCPV